MERRHPKLLSAEKKRDFFDQLDAFLASGRRPRSADGQRAHPPRERSATVMTNDGEPMGRGGAIEANGIVRDAEDGQDTKGVMARRVLPTTITGTSKRRASTPSVEKKPTRVKKARASTNSVDPHGLVLHGQRVLLVPIGSDVSRKRLEIWRDMVVALGGIVVSAHGGNSAQKAQHHAQLLHLHSVPDRFSEGSREHNEKDTFDWHGVDIVIVSAQVDAARLTQYYHFADDAVPSHLKLVTPEWLVHVRNTKEVPEDENQFAWCHEIARVSRENHADEIKETEKAENEDESGVENEDGSDRKNVTSREIIRAPPVRVDTEKLRREQDELQKKKEKLVKERIPIFHELNPRFKTIANAGDTTHSVKMEAFVCQKSSVMQANLNAHLTDPLEALMEFLHVERDIWRQYSYKKVVSSLKAMRTRVSSVRDLKGLWWAKGRMRDKVAEVLETGKLEKLEAKKSNPRLRTLVEMSRIWGVGPATAAKLYNMGYKTMDALRSHSDEVLNFQQQIGLKHYQDFMTKIPRPEVVEIEKTVVDEVHRILPNATALACGSYRRGKLSSGDVDILITDPDSEECDILPDLLRRLHDMGFLTDDLTHLSDHHMGRCDSYMGVCRLREGLPFRRLDIKVYPRRYFGFALLYFTGSDHFNRSMRLFARKKGWSLSDRYLKRVVRVRKGVKLESGESVVCPEEVDVFIALGLEYKGPTERNCFDIRFLEEDEAQAKKRKSAGDADAGENVPATMTSDSFGETVDFQ